MNSRGRTMLGALLACALAVCAFGAANASAKGLTAVECENVGAGNGTFDNAHCVTPEVVKGEYKTVEIPVNTPKEVEGKDTRTIGAGHGAGSTANPVATFHDILAGIKSTLTCGKGVITGGKIENRTVGEEMEILTTEGTALWSECHFAKEDGTKICEVEGIAPATAKGSIKTNPLAAITGPNHTVTINSEKVEEGKPTFTKFKVIGGGTCFSPVNITVTVTGEAMGTANTTTHSHVTINEPWPCGGPEQPACGNLKVNGNNAAQTETVTGFTKGAESKTVGATTVPEVQ